MPPDTTSATPLFDTAGAHGSAAALAEISAGLLADHAHVSPKFLYDALGSRLFEAICELPEYYPTRTEAAIFAAHGEAMARAIGPGSTLIDLGAGNCAKAASLFPLEVGGDVDCHVLRRLQQGEQAGRRGAVAGTEIDQCTARPDRPCHCLAMRGKDGRLGAGWIIFRQFADRFEQTRAERIV